MTDKKKTAEATATPKRRKQTEGPGEIIKEKDPIAYEIKRAREAKDLSISDLSRLTGISRPVLLGYEAGRTRPGSREIRLIAQALKVTPNRLLFGNEEPFEARKGVAALVAFAASNQVVGMSTLMLLLPIATAILSEEERMAFLSLLLAMVEARDKAAFKHIRAFAEVFGEEIGTPEKMAAFNALQKDRAKAAAFQAEMQAKMEKRFKEI